VPEAGLILADLSCCILAAVRELLPDRRLLSSPDRPLLVWRLPLLLCLFWVVFFDFCPLLRRAVDAFFMVCWF
jgi:hypothetical protein